METEIGLRLEAMQRLLSGETQTSISHALGKSPKWVNRWAKRYDPDDPVGSLDNRSSAPKEPHHKWSAEVKAMVLSSRQLRMAADQVGYEYALIGAEAIHFELKALGVEPVPPIRTIHAWIEQAGLVSVPPTPETDQGSSKPYPAPICQTVNDVHQLDLKGPIYLKGSSHKYYLLALRDFYSKAVALAAAQNREAQSIANFLVAAWQKIGLPKTLQMDNGLEFRGSNRYPRSFGKVVRLCLDVGVEPLFIPPREPWRNGFIENFNGQAQRLLLNHDDFAHYSDLQNGIHQFEQAVNTTHRLAALDGKTPHEFRAAYALRYLPPDYDRHLANLKLDQGSIAFIRLVRKSGRITLQADDKFDIDPDLAWHYVLARVNVADKQLLIYHDRQLLKSFDF
jgi:putative transposase